MSGPEIKDADWRNMGLAYEQAKGSFDREGVPVGAVLVAGEELLGAGHSRQLQERSPILHGVMDCLEKAGRRADYSETTLYSTLSPCMMCAGTIVQFGIRRVVVGETSSSRGQLRFLRRRGVEVAVLGDGRGAELMAKFRRENRHEGPRRRKGGSPPSGFQEAWFRSDDDKHMSRALEQAQKSFDEDGLPIGAVLVAGDEVLGVGHNQRVQLESPILHGETDCLRQVGWMDDYSRTTIYTTLSPCMMCAGTIVELGIPRVVVGEDRNYPGNIDFLVARGVQVRLMDDPGCIALMGRLKREKPKLWKEDIAGEEQRADLLDQGEESRGLFAKLREQLPLTREDNVRHVRALRIAREDDNHDALFSHLYQTLSILDEKCGALLAYNGIIIAAFAVFLSREGQSEIAWPGALTWLFPYLGVASSLASSAILLKVLWVHWSRPRELMGDLLNHAEELSWVRRRRTIAYRKAWCFSFAAAPGLLGLHLFFVVLQRLGVLGS